MAVLTIGPIGNDVEQVIQELQAEGCTRSVAHYDMRFLKPIDESILQETAENCRRIITVEDGTRKGGLGSAVIEWLNDHDYNIPVTRIGLPDEFVEHGTVSQLREIVGMDNESIKKAIRK